MGGIRINLSSESDTFEFGKALAAKIQPGAILALFGTLGAGKTTFVKGLGAGLGIREPIQSPTFTYLNLYASSVPLYHFDLYRLKKASDFFSLGFEEYLEMEGICAIEWPDIIAAHLPPRTISIHFSYDGLERIAEISSPIEQELIV
jgi:tRNA threonylcarbamoyladenosine biosynthesis protein TsaE